jgi:hypothetical protein
VKGVEGVWSGKVEGVWRGRRACGGGGGRVEGVEGVWRGWRACGGGGGPILTGLREKDCSAQTKLSQLLIISRKR